MSKKDWETNGLDERGEPIYCPLRDVSCPYLDYDGLCHIANPEDECDDFWDGE